MKRIDKLCDMGKLHEIQISGPTVKFGCHMVVPVHFSVIYGHFLVTTAELSGSIRNRMATKA